VSNLTTRHVQERSDTFTVAHRINTILDSDRIVVLDHGTVKEFDTPANLVKSKGLFYELVKESGLLGSVDSSGSIL
jgi:ABC-type multidrug transport system fused ATPase/permease subunit